jgi:hypothetical protein
MVAANASASAFVGDASERKRLRDPTSDCVGRARLGLRAGGRRSKRPGYR